MITIWFEPHSTSLDNEAGLASGWNDVDLSELGLQQSEELEVRCEEREIDAIFVSDLQRSVKSVLPLSDVQRIPIFVDSRLRECNYGSLTQADKQAVNEAKMQHIELAFPEGESYNDCMVRMGEFLKELKENFEDSTVLIVGHRATQYGLEYHINNRSLEELLQEDWQWQPGWMYQF